ncbi:MAG: cysteine--tRNA ligase [Pseudomonadota bacterium]
MAIRLRNSLTRKVEDFTPLDDKNVRMYVCGPTVYDRAHLGNARPAVVFDLLYRLLRHEYGADHVTYARNFTDVDDKINARAAETGRDIRDITDETIGWFHEDMDALGALRPNHEPRATEYIGQMVDMISELVEKDLAYAAEGHVLFRVKAYDAYGALSGRSVDDMIAGARVEVTPYKEDPMDFVLWKPSSGIEPGWDSPWGYGRPGWHIECSAMARDLLGEKFDIHGGGLDLQFPHHENEIAQSKACCGDDSFAQVWMHNEMLQVEGKKMSKSLGNFFTVRELLDQGWPGEVVRFVMLSTHYSKPMDWTEKKAREARAHFNRWRATLSSFANSSSIDEMVLEALNEDLNTPKAIARIHQLWKSGNTEDLNAMAGSLRFLGIDPSFAGMNPDNEEPNVGYGLTSNDRLTVNDISEVWQNLRSQKSFEQADRIRNRCLKLGLDLSLWSQSTDPEAGIDAQKFDSRGLKAFFKELSE